MANDDAVVERLTQLLLPLDHAIDVPEIPEDHPLASLFPDGLTPAAVLVPLIRRSGWQVLLTQRTELLTNHGGQISFPGGRREPTDRDFIHTALRETHEEVGIAPEQVQIVGYLDPQPVITGFGVVPVVGVVIPGHSLALDANEVAEAFEVPLEFLLDRANYTRDSISIRGNTRYYHVVQYQQWRIWGATASMLNNLATRWNDD